VGPYAVIGEHAVVKPCSYVKAHTHVAPGETWSGVPATAESDRTSPLAAETA
jgi:carbonic anhydrase/acetyltransferase-like protein (isoleucine patch superfamily)